MISVGRVGMIPIDSIIISDRTREVMGDLDSMESNMKEIGLTSPLTVKITKMVHLNSSLVSGVLLSLNGMMLLKFPLAFMMEI
jgi:hypothetical protein